MTFKEFMGAVGRFPGTAVEWIFSLILGRPEEKNAQGVVVTGKITGLLDLGVDLFQWVATALAELARAIVQSVTVFIGNHKKAIAVAGWTSLAVAGIAALVVGLWPAALVAVAGLSISGVSIASLVGTGFAAQVAAVAGVGAVLASAAVYTVATVSNIVGWLKGCFAASRSVPAPVSTSRPNTTDDLNGDELDEAAFKAPTDPSGVLAPIALHPSALAAANHDVHQAPRVYPTLAATGLTSAGVGLRAQSATPVRNEAQITPALGPVGDEALSTPTI